MARTSSLRREPVSFPVEIVTPSHERPVDLVHLSHQTMGDTCLEREVLGLLSRQIAVMTGRIDKAVLPERSTIAHALKGAALNVGAFRLARSAAALEQTPASNEALADFKREMAIASGFISDLMRGHSAPR